MSDGSYMGLITANGADPPRVESNFGVKTIISTRRLHCQCRKINRAVPFCYVNKCVVYNKNDTISGTQTNAAVSKWEAILDKHFPNTLRNTTQHSMSRH